MLSGKIACQHNLAIYTSMKNIYTLIKVNGETIIL